MGSFSTGAGAAAFQTDTDRTPLPQPVGAGELNLGVAWGFARTTEIYKDPVTGESLSTPILYGEYYSPPKSPQFEDGDAFTLQGLFKWRREAIDPIEDASAKLGHFRPGCEVTAELVLHGGSCDVQLGWYNYKDGSPPSPMDIQLLVPKGSTYLNAKLIEDLVPLAWDNRYPRDLSQILWTPQAFSTGDLAANPNYAGGDIAFVMLGDTARGCTVSKYSVYEHNPNNADGAPWVTALTYRSKVTPNAVYLAFEDLPMKPENWRNSGGLAKNDGDFNDAVYFITGLGAGASCAESPGAGGASGAAGSGGDEASAGAAGAAPSGAAGAASTDSGGAGGAATSQAPGTTAPMNGGAAEDNQGGEPNVNSPSEGGASTTGSATSEASNCACRLHASRRSALPQLIALGLSLGAACARRRRR